MEVTVYWSEKGFGGLVQSHTTPYPTGEDEWGEWAVKWECTTTEPPHKWALAICQYNPHTAGVKLPVISGGGWVYERLLLAREAESRESYMAWIDENVDMVTVDGNLFFKSSRFSDD